MRLVCLLVNHLPTRVEALSDLGAVTRPCIVLREWDDRVLDASEDAMAAGVTIGDSRRRVEQVCPQAVIRIARESVYQAHHDQLRAILSSFASGVETSALGELFIDIAPLARAFPSEEALTLHLIQQADQASALRPVVGIASNKFTAYQAAHQIACQSDAQGARVLSVPDGGERRFLEPLPLQVLPEPPAELLRRLYLFGITTLGGFAQLPHAAVVLQFGSDLAFYHDLARGLDPRPVVPQSPPPTLIRTWQLPEPLSDRALVLRALDRLATRLAQRLGESGHHALALSVTVGLANGQEYSTGAPVKPPSADAEQLRRLAARLLGKLAFESEVSTLTLIAYPLREWHYGARQLSLLDTPISPKLTQLRAALRLLQQRFGEAVICLASALGPPLPLPIRVNTQPDGTPLGLGWGRWSRRVTNVYEYWCEQRAWWEQPLVRDYYQIEAGEGIVFTLFRDAEGQWFLDRRRGWTAP